MRDRLLKALGTFAVRHAWIVIIAALLISLASSALTPQLKILTSRTALYPTNLEVNKKFNDFLEEFGTTSSLIAVVEGDEKDIALFAEDMVTELKKEREVVKDVFYKADVNFFRDRAFLFISTEQMEKLRDKVKENESGIEEFGKMNGLLPLFDKFVKADPTAAFKDNLDIDSARQILTFSREFFNEFDRWLSDPKRNEIKIIENVFVEELSKHKGYDNEGYLRSFDRKMLFMFIQPSSNSDEFEFLQKLVGRSRAVAADVAEKWKKDGRTPPTYGFTGIPAQGEEENIAIRHDVVFTATVSAVLILLIILIGFRSIRRGIIVFIPLVLSGLWNLGLTTLTIGHLTLLTSAFTAILFGLGVDYGIFISGRIDENLKSGMSLDEAIIAALRSAGKTLLTAGGTTMMAFFVIGTVDFTGFAELGIVAGCGVFMVILAMLLLLPAMVKIFGVSARSQAVAAKTEDPTVSSRRPPMVYTGFISLVALFITAISIYYAFDVPIDFELKTIMPKNSESMRLQYEMSQRSDFQPEFLAVPAKNVEEARTLTDKLSQLPTVAKVESITMLLPEDQEKKVELMQDIVPVFNRVLVTQDGFADFSVEDLSDRLETLLDVLEDSQEKAFAAGQKEIVADLENMITKIEDISDKLEENDDALERSRAFEKAIFATINGGVEQIKKWSEMGPIKAEDLPTSLLDRFRGKSGKFSIFVFPKGSIYNVDFLDKFVADVYAVSPDATGFPATHQVFSRLILKGFSQATLYAAIVVLLLLLVDFRHLGYALAAALPLICGAAWMLGWMYFTRTPHNYANIIALPLIIGLAVDYGVYITHRLKEDRELHPFATMELAARPVFMAALTTLAGIGAIIMGQHQGAASLGKNLICGIVTCLIAAMVVLPSVVSFVRDLRKRKSEK